MSSDVRGSPPVHSSRCSTLSRTSPSMTTTWTSITTSQRSCSSAQRTVCTGFSAMGPTPEIIRLSGYTEIEKLSIAKRYLIPKQTAANGLKDDQLTIAERPVRRSSAGAKEAGVRNLDAASCCARRSPSAWTKARTGEDHLHQCPSSSGCPSTAMARSESRMRRAHSEWLGLDQRRQVMVNTIEAVSVFEHRQDHTDRAARRCLQESCQAAITHIRSQYETLGQLQEVDRARSRALRRRSVRGHRHCTL